MVIPVVVVSDVVARSFVLHALKIAFTVIPEVIVGVGNVGGLFSIKGTVALFLVSVASCVAVEEIAVMYPDVVVALLETAVVAF